MKVMDYVAYLVCMVAGSLYFTFYLLFFDKVAYILSSFLLSAIMLGLIPPTIIIIGIHVAHITNLISREKCQNLTLTFTIGIPLTLLLPYFRFIFFAASFNAVGFLLPIMSFLISCIFIYGLWRTINDELEGKEPEKSLERRKFMKLKRFMLLSSYFPLTFIAFSVFLAGFVWEKYDLVAFSLLSTVYIVAFLYTIYRIIFFKYRWLIENNEY